ncbi:unnamed protein product [Adineta steineri]|uniref:Uncharacterized protein n=1 Tax=Adineta steineri TaxID=433720 RepID=A0A818ZER2_9BILA|nr:unnamed protein product [Adineta steineri]
MDQRNQNNKYPKNSRLFQNTQYQYSNPFSSYNQHDYHPLSSIDTTFDLTESLPTFYDIRSVEPSRYIPADLTQLPSINNIDPTDTSHVRADIQKRISDIDRNLTSLEQKSTILHDIPTHFPPIIKQNIQQTMTTQKYENHIWPDKPKRVYEVRPSLKINENQPLETMKTNISSSNLPLHSEYDYELDTEDLLDDSKSSDQFLLDLPIESQTYTINFDSKCNDNDLILSSEDTESLLQAVLEMQLEAELNLPNASHDTILPVTSNKKSSSLQLATNKSTTINSFLKDNDLSSLAAYLFGGSENQEDFFIDIDENNYIISTNVDIIINTDSNCMSMKQFQTSSVISGSTNVLEEQQNLTSEIPSTIKRNNQRVKAAAAEKEEKEEEEEEIKRKKISVIKKPIATATSILPSPSSSSLKQVLPSSIIDSVQTQFSLNNNNRKNNNYYRKPSNTILNTDAFYSSIEEEQKKLSNNSKISPYSSSSLILQIHFPMPAEIPDTSDEEIEQNNEEMRSISSTSRNSEKDIDNEGNQTPERLDSADHRVQSSSSSHSSLSSKTSSKDNHRESATTRKSSSRQKSQLKSEHSHSSRQRHSSSSSSSTDHDVEHIHKTPVDDNEDSPDNKSETSRDNNQRSPSDHSISQLSRSGLSSSTGSAVPVDLDASDMEEDEPSKLRTKSPKKKSSASSTTKSQHHHDKSPTPTDKTNNIKHLQMSPTQKLNREVSDLKRKESIRSVHNVPTEKLQNNVLQMKEPLHKPSTDTHHNSSQDPEVKSKNDPLPSNHKQEDTPSISKNKHHQPILDRNASITSPTHHKDVIHSTSSTVPSTHEQQEQKPKEPLLTVSITINETKNHSPENLGSKAEYHDTHSSPTSSNHTSTKGVDLSPKNLQNERSTSSTHNDHPEKQTLKLPSTQPTFATEIQRRPSMEKSDTSLHSESLQDIDPQPRSTPIPDTKYHSSSSSIQNEEELPSNQQHKERRHSIKNHPAPLPNIVPRNISPINNDENHFEQDQHHRRVSFSGSTEYAHVEEEEDQRHNDANWRERVASILASKHNPNEKYAYVQARVNSFENFEYHPRKFPIVTKKKQQSKTKDSKVPREIYVYEQIGDEQQIHPARNLPAQMFGRLMFLSDGSPTIFHEPLEWNAQSKLKDYVHENIHYTPRQHEIKVHRKPRWNSESRLSEFGKESPRFGQTQALVPANSLPIITDADESYFYQQQFNTRLETNYPNNISYDTFDEKQGWTKKSKIPDQNTNPKPKESEVQNFPRPTPWNDESKFEIRLPLKVNPSRTTLNNGQIFNEKLNWNAKSKVHCWSESDLRQIGKKKSNFTQYQTPKRKNPMMTSINETRPKMTSNQPAKKRDSNLNDFLWENDNNKPHRRIRKSPANKPKWNEVSKTRSINTVYNPKAKHTDTIHRGRDREVRRKRVDKLPPLKRKREHEQIPQLPPSATHLAIDYDYDPSPIAQGHTSRSEYAKTSSRRSSRALVPLNHHQRFPDLELPSDTPRSHRPIQQEWYDDMNKSRLTHRMDTEGGSTNHSFVHSITPILQPNTPRELVPYRSTPRISENSFASGTLLDSSIRTNRATEIRLSRDMDAHHQHCHDVSQSMPLEIRGFELAGTQCTVPVDATIRPLSNVNYRTSERVKNHRLYPWSMLHGTSSRNSSLVPIAEFRRTSLDTTITETHQS